jgi:hypothetical protein
MNQKIRRIESLKYTSKTVDDTATGVNKFISDKLQLVKDFGTNKAKKQISNMKSTAIGEGNISSSRKMAEMITEKAVQQEENLRTNPEKQLGTKIANMRNMLPPFDDTTDDVSSIFSQESSKFIC